MNTRYTIICLLALLAFSSPLYSQSGYHTLTLPEASPMVSETQRLGITDITIDYHSPAVKGRTVWGELVPYHDASDIPWRAGANENTVITFSTDVKVAGQPLAAGSYGLHMLPEEGGPWTVILSRFTHAWGSYEYRQDEDALRFTASPQEAPMQEYLAYDFTDRTDSTLQLSMTWEKVRISIPVEVDVLETTMQSLRQELRSNKGYAWEAWVAAAEFCLQHNTHLEEGLAWTNRALAGSYDGYGAIRNFPILYAKARILERLGREQEAGELLDEAGTMLSDVGDYMQFGFRKLYREDKPEEALAIFQKAIEKHPDNYAAYFGLVHTYRKMDKPEQAYEAAEKILAIGAPYYRSSYKATLEKLLGRSFS